VRDLVRIAVRRQISVEISAQLGLASDALWTPPEGT